MGFSKNDFDKVDLRIKNITEQTVEQIEVDSELPPTIEQLEDNNKNLFHYGSHTIYRYS